MSGIADSRRESGRGNIGANDPKPTKRRSQFVYRRSLSLGNMDNQRPEGEIQMTHCLRVCLFVVFAAICGLPTALAQTDPVSIFRQAIEARNRGDLEALMQFFAPEAVREDGSCQPPCVGLAAVRRSFEKNIAEHFQATLTSAEGSGDTVTAGSEIRSDAFRARGIESRMTSYTIKFKDGKIVRWSSPLPGPANANPPKQ